MILLQAAIGFGLLIMEIFRGAIFVDIPILSVLVFNIISKGKSYADSREKNRIRLRSLVIAVLAIAIILCLIWVFFLSNIDLTYS